jgi:hypothetical protein
VRLSGNRRPHLPVAVLGPQREHGDHSGGSADPRDAVTWHAVRRDTDDGVRQAAGWGSPAEDRRQEACSRA